MNIFPFKQNVQIAPQVNPGVQPEVAVSANAISVNRISPMAFAHIAIPLAIPPEQNLPDASTQNGNIFTDRFNKNLQWYLPGFVLSSAPDAFSFSAIQQDSNDLSGNPWHTASIKLGLQKILPSDVSDFKSKNPSADLREIPLGELKVTLTIPYKDDNGADMIKTFSGAITSTDGSYQAIFDNILGTYVIMAYRCLTTTVGAQILLSASYDVWKPKQISTMYPATQLSTFQLIRPVAPVAAQPAPLMANRMVFQKVNLQGADDAATQTNPNNDYESAKIYLNNTVAIGKTFSMDVYQTKYTVTYQSKTKIIINVDDLKDFNIKQSEFTELKTIDLSRYPSVQKLYLGTLSGKIVVIPWEYVILREGGRFDATCFARVDTSYSSQAASNCKFEFAFTVAPKISPIELNQLFVEINNLQDLKKYSSLSLTCPNSLNISEASTLSNTLLANSSCKISGAQNPKWFSVSVEIANNNGGSTAIADANEFIQALCLTQTYPSSTVSFKLDDNFNSPVNSNVILNFHENIGTGLDGAPDETGQNITVTNTSAFNYVLQRYAFLCGSQLLISSFNQNLASQQSLSIPLPAGQAVNDFFIDYVLDIAGPISKKDIDKYLYFYAQDIQNSQYQISVHTNCDFDKNNVAFIGVVITVPSLPQIVSKFNLYKDSVSGSSAIVIPIQNAISSMKSSILFTVNFTDTSKAPRQFTKEYDFIADGPLYNLTNEDIAAALQS